jgi:hypothetical protein
MSDRKYRQRGYQDDDRNTPRAPRAPGPRPRAVQPEGPRAPNLMQWREVIRCARCAGELASADVSTARCGKCGAELHACTQCTFFDSGARLQCLQPIVARIAVKDARNDCPLWKPRTTVERETQAAAPKVRSAGFRRPLQVAPRGTPTQKLAFLKPYDACDVQCTKAFGSPWGMNPICPFSSLCPSSQLSPP